MNIQEHLNKIRNATYGREVRESIAKGIETVYDDASENGNANMEVEIARGTHPTLRDRLNEVDNTQKQTTAQLAHKANKAEVRKIDVPITLNDADAELLSAIEGGEGTSFDLLSVPQNNSVTAEKLAPSTADLLGIVLPYNLFDGTYVQGNINSTNGELVNQSNVYARATEFIPVSDAHPIYTNITDWISEFMITFYDKNFNRLGMKASSVEEVNPIENTRFIRTQLAVDGLYTLPLDEIYFKQPVNKNKEKIVANSDELKTVNRLLNVEQSEDLFDESKTSQHIYDRDLGKVSRSGSSFLSFKTEVNDDRTVMSNLIDVNTYDNSQQTALFFDKDDVYLGYQVVDGYSFNLPKGTKWFVQNLRADGINLNTDLTKYRVWHDVHSQTISEIYKKIENHGKSQVNTGNELLKRIFETEFDNLLEEEWKAYAVEAIDFDSEGMADIDIIEETLEYSEKFTFRVIVLSERDWHLSRSIKLPSDTILIVDGVKLKQDDQVFDNVIRGDNLVINQSNPFHYPLEVNPLKNIKIIGLNGASIEGPDVNRVGLNERSRKTEEMVGDEWGWRTLQISLSKCENFEVAGFDFTKTRCWAISFDKCKYGSVHDIDVQSMVKNGDGVDIRSGSSHIDIYNISGLTFDDGIALSAIEYFSTFSGNPYFYPMEPSEFESKNYDLEDLAIHDINIYNTTITSYIKPLLILSNDGRKVYNVSVNNMTEPADGRSGHPSMILMHTGYGGSNPYKDGDIHSVRVNNVTSERARNVIDVDVRVEDVWLNKIEQKNPEGTLFKITDDEGIKITNS